MTTARYDSRGRGSRWRDETTGQWTSGPKLKEGEAPPVDGTVIRIRVRVEEAEIEVPVELEVEEPELQDWIVEVEVRDTYED